MHILGEAGRNKNFLWTRNKAKIVPTVQLEVVPPIINSTLSPPQFLFLTVIFFPENIGRLPLHKDDLALVILAGLNPRTVPAVVDLLAQILIRLQ